MALNKKGTGLIITLMLATLFFFFGLAVAPALVEIAGEQMTALSCDTATNSFTKGTCVLIDLMAPYFVGVIFALGGAVITARLL
jgi:hypothetical protein